MHYAGEINNSPPKYSSMSYQMVNCHRPGDDTAGNNESRRSMSHKWNAKNNADDTRKLDVTDSVQMLTRAL